MKFSITPGKSLIKITTILKLGCLKNKHILSIFSSLRIFLIASISSQIKCKEYYHTNKFSQTLKLSYYKILNVKETITMFRSNTISDHEMSFEIKHTIKHNFRLKILSILSFNLIYPYACIKKVY